MYVRYFLLWLPMIVIAFLNATLRELIIAKYFNEVHSHQVSTITLILFFIFYIWLVFPRLHVTKVAEALIVGLIWTALTILFEFGLGLLTHHSLESLVQEYDLSAGNIWPVFLVCLLLLPYLFYRLRKQKTG